MLLIPYHTVPLGSTRSCLGGAQLPPGIVQCDAQTTDTLLDACAQGLCTDCDGIPAEPRPRFLDQKRKLDLIILKRLISTRVDAARCWSCGVG